MKWPEVVDNALEGLFWIAVIFMLAGGVKYVCGPLATQTNVRSVIEQPIE